MASRLVKLAVQGEVVLDGHQPIGGGVTLDRLSQSGWLVGLDGDHDLSSARRLEAVLRSIWPDPVVIDLADATFIDSAIIGVITRCAGDTDGGVRVVVASTPGSWPRRVLDLVGLAHRVSVLDDRASAIDALDGSSAMDSAGPATA